MTTKIPLIIICSLMVTGCYSKRVERIEKTSPERVIVHDRPERNIVVEEHDTNEPVTTERRRTTVIQHE